MRIIAISDTHGKQNELDIPECDILIHSGDVCPHLYGRSNWTLDAKYQKEWLEKEYIPWLEGLKAKYIIQIFGNHDFVGEDFNMFNFPWPKNATYLQDTSVTIEGLKIFGSPFSCWFHDWAFNAPQGIAGRKFLHDKWGKIPENTDIIVTHGPPYGFGDIGHDGQNVGDKDLLDRITEIKPKLVVGGHIHSGHSVRELEIEGKNIKIVNASVVNEAYKIYYKPIIIDL